MAKETDDDPFRTLAAMAARNPKILKLLEILCELTEAHGSEGVDAFLDTLEKYARDSERVARTVPRHWGGQVIPEPLSPTSEKVRQGGRRQENCLTGGTISRKAEAVRAASRAAAVRRQLNQHSTRGGVKVREIKSYTERGFEFVEMIADWLPIGGSHVAGSVHVGRGLIIRSREAPEEDLASMREALATGRGNDLAFATADVLKGGYPEFISAVRLPAFWVLGQYLDAGIVCPKWTSR